MTTTEHLTLHFLSIPHMNGDAPRRRGARLAPLTGGGAATPRSLAVTAKTSG